MRGDVQSPVLPHRVGRNKGNAKGVIELHCHSELDARSLESAFRDTSRRGSILSHEQGHVGEQSGRDVPALRPCVLGRDDQDKLIEHSRGQTFLARGHRMPPDDAKIESRVL